MSGRRIAAGRAVLLAALPLLAAGCAGDDPELAAAPTEEAAAEAAAYPAPGGLAAPEATAPASPQISGAPTVYMNLEADPGRPVSVVFAIDGGGVPGPSDDPALRLSPEGGECNPQELSRYAFAGEAARPAFDADNARNVAPEELPEFMAVAVSQRMMDRGLAETLEDTRPQNVCTRKLWERLVAGQTRAGLAPAGQ